jgi:PhnB protein
MLKSIPFLLFDGQCAEAMSFYHRCIGGELGLTPLSETPMKDQFPVEKHGRIIYAHLQCGDLELSASDWMASPALEPMPGNTTAVFVTGTDHAELRRVFEGLKDGSNNTHLQELHEMPAGLYGQFFDRYGVQWIFMGR